MLGYSPLYPSTQVMEHAQDQEKGGQRSHQKIFWPKDPVVVELKEDPGSLGLTEIQEAAIDTRTKQDN